MIALNVIASRARNRRNAANGPKIRKLLFICLCVCLWTFSGCHRLFSKPEAEIQLPDGDIPGALPIDAMLDGAQGIALKAVNFTQKSIDMVTVDSHGGVSMDDGMGSTGSGIDIAIPRKLHPPFYVRISWSDFVWYERYISREYGPAEANFDICKSKLVKVTKPVPPDPKTFLVIFYPNDRIECEILGENPSAWNRVQELRILESPK